MMRSVLIGLCVATIALGIPTTEEIVPETALFSGDSDYTSFQEARSTVNSMLAAGKTNAECRKLADDSSKAVKETVKTSQKILDALPDGSACTKAHDDAVKKATDLKEKAEKEASAAENAAAKACSVKVDFGEFGLDELAPGKCDIFYSKPAYTKAVKGCDDAKKAKEKAKGAKDEAIKALAQTKESAAETLEKCLCEVQENAKKEWEKATKSEEDDKKEWAKAHHLLCALDGTPYDQCQVPDAPAPKKPQITAAAQAAVCKLKKGAAMVVNGAGTTLHYDQAFWTDDTTGNYAGGSYKNPELWNAKIQKLRVNFVTGTQSRDLYLDIPNKSLKELFNGGEFKTNIETRYWRDAGGTYYFAWQNNCNLQGFNVKTAHMRVRFGIIMNQESDCRSPDTEIGVGMQSSSPNCAGAYCTCCANGGTCRKIASKVTFYINGA